MFRSQAIDSHPYENAMVYYSQIRLVLCRCIHAPRQIRGLGKDFIVEHRALIIRFGGRDPTELVLT